LGEHIVAALSVHQSKEIDFQMMILFSLIVRLYCCINFICHTMQVQFHFNVVVDTIQESCPVKIGTSAKSGVMPLENRKIRSHAP
jgi:hypothetical protein